MKNTTSLYFLNEVQNPDLRKISFSDGYSDSLDDIIGLALQPIEDFIHFMDESMKKKSQNESDIISVLYALHRNAKALLTRFDDDLTRHAGDVSVLKYSYSSFAPLKWCKFS
jgi:hypothetical protein